MEYPNWFASTPAQDNFSRILAPFKGKPDLKFLQLGVYTGDASVWLMENILTDPSSMLIDVDTWEGSDEEAHNKMDFGQIYVFYLSRMKQYANSYSHMSTTLNFLRYCEDEFDFIYIDADHTAVGVLLDAELSWDLLKPGGIMAFDDYEWSDGKGDAYRPMPGINTFLDRHKDELIIIHKDWQLWVVKK